MSNILTSGSAPGGSLSALIQQYYMPVLYDNIFKKSHPLLALMKQKAQTFNGREIVVPVEYQAGGQTAFGDQHTISSAYNPAIADIAQTASYKPTMLTGHFLLTKEETLLMNSPQAIKNIVGAKVQNLQKQLEKVVAENLFKVSLATDAFNPLGHLLNNVSGNSQSVTVGGITVTTDGSGAFTANEFWQTPVLQDSDFADASGDVSPSPSVDHLSEDDMQDPAKDTYILRVLARGIAKAKAQTGENPDLIVMSQYHYDLLESELGEFKRGSLESDRMAKMGFVGMSYRGIDIVSDTDIVTAQSSDVDGRIYFLNTEYLYMFFNSGAKFTASDMVEDPRSNTFVQKVHTYGNMVVTNRKAHCVVKHLYSPRSYS